MRFAKSATLAGGAAAFFLCITAADAAEPPVVVELSDTARKAPDYPADIAKSAGASVTRTLGRGRYLVLEPSADKSTSAVAKQLRLLPGVVYAGPAHTYTLNATFPDDPQFSPNQWALHNTGQTITYPNPSDPSQNISKTGVADADIDAPEAWDQETGSASVVVAVIDTGFPLGNADLQPNIWTNSGEVPGDGIDNDGNGYVDDVHGWNTFADSSNISDDHGHGSFCSGIIGARGNNGLGVAGINWDVSIMTLKAFGSDGTSMDVELAAAVDYAAENGARVINASWGDYYNSPLIENAVRRAADAGVLFVAATGNDRRDISEIPHYPASLNVPNVVAVGATNISDEWAPFSNFDGTLVHCHAPGDTVFSTRQTKNEYGSGTSFAAPQVAGVAALLLAQEPALSMHDLRLRLISAFEPLVELEGRSVTGGRLSAHVAVTAHQSDPTAPAAIDDLRSGLVASNGFELFFTAPGDDGADGTAAWYDFRYATEPLTAGNFAEAVPVPGVPVPATAGTVLSFFVSGLDADTTYYFAGRAMDEAGNASAFGNVAVLTTAGQTVYFADDAETDTGLWTFTGGFARTDETAANGAWCWTDSPGEQYPASTTSTMVSPAIDLSSAANPQLTFQHQYLFEPSFTIASDYGQVQVSTDAANWTSLTQYIDSMHPFHPARVSLSDYAGEPQVYLRFRMRADFIDREIIGDGWHIDDIVVADPDVLLPDPLEITVESATRFDSVASAPDYVETDGAEFWRSEFGKPRLPQVRARHSRYKPLGEPGTAQFTPRLLTDGWYDVYAGWGDSANAANVRYAITHAGGTDEVFLDQNSPVNGHRWMHLGRYPFTAGQDAAAGAVLVDDSTVTGPAAGGAGRVYADSVRFVYRGPVEAAGWWLVR